jgi:hypothetical protein
MNKLHATFLILVSGLLLLNSCGNDEDKENEERLTGNWVAIQLERTGCNNVDANIINSRDLYNCDQASCLTLSLTEDGGYLIVERTGLTEVAEEGTWSVSGNQLILTYSEEGEDFARDRIFVISSDQLILTEFIEQTGCEESITYARGTDDFAS